MKKTTFLFVLLLIFSSCEKKEAYVPDDEIPGWLKDIVNGYELSLQQNPNNLVLSGPLG